MPWQDGKINLRTNSNKSARTIFACLNHSPCPSFRNPVGLAPSIQRIGGKKPSIFPYSFQIDKFANWFLVRLECIRLNESFELKTGKKTSKNHHFGLRVDHVFRIHSHLPFMCIHGQYCMVDIHLLGFVCHSHEILIIPVSLHRSSS